MEKNGHIFLKKLMFTIMIAAVYFVGRELPLYGIDVSAYTGSGVGLQNILMQTVSGDANKCSLFALGISPYMGASILVQMCMALKSREARAKTSPKKINRLLVTIAFVWALAQAVMYTGELHFRVEGEALFLAKGIAGIEMVCGAFIILWLSERNKKYGIGGQTALIFVNVIDGIIRSMLGKTGEELWIPLVISLLVMFVMLVMENSQLEIPVQRISIHNIYADKDYLAIKLNPIGIMPVMFSAAFFMIPQMLLSLLVKAFPKESTLLFLQENISLSNPLGLAVYIADIYLLTLVFSIMFISPADITEQFLKSGDSILNIHAGADTKRYLKKRVIILGFFSATVMAVCVGVPLFLQMRGELSSALVMLPSSFMILTGLWCSLYQDALAAHNLDRYKPFLA